MTHKLGIFKNESNTDYHKENGFYSSSTLKTLLDDPMRYYHKYVLKDTPQQKKDCFDVGNAWHTKILEPHLFDKEYAHYDGRKAGPKWKEFEKKHEGKTILGNKQKMEVDILCEGIDKSKVVKPFLEGSHEISIYIKLDGFPVKVRFDTLNIEKGFGADPKSTTGDLLGIKGRIMCQKKIAGLDYDLSAALYLDALNEINRKIAEKEGKEFTPVNDWYWIFASKDYVGCRVFKASEKMLQNGRKKYKMAIALLKKYEAANWDMSEFEDKIEELDPLDSDLILTDEPVEVMSW